MLQQPFDGIKATQSSGKIDAVSEARVARLIILPGEFGAFQVYLKRYSRK
jgi:hypothetical protein